MFFETLFLKRVLRQFYILQERDLLNKFSLNPNTVLRDFWRLQDLYKPNPYNNGVHAADVAQSCHVLLNTPALNVRIRFSIV